MSLHPAVAALALFACSAPPRPAPPIPAVSTTTPALAEGAVLQWTDAGDALFVGARYRVEAESGVFTALGASDPAAPLAVSPDGIAAIFGPDTVRVIGGRLLRVPSFFDPPRTGPMVGFWLDDDRLYLHQHHPDDGRAACRVFSFSRDGFTTPAGGCLEGVTPEITRLQRGRNGVVAVFSGRDELSGARVVHYDPATGTRAVPGGGPFDLRPGGALTVGFPAAGGAVHLVSPCRLGAPRPCVGDAPPDGRHQLFALDLATGHLSAPMLRVPPGTAPAPDGRRLAWIRRGEVCVSAPRTGATWCHSPPGAAYAVWRR